MIFFEQQRLSINQKDEQWRKNMVDSICSRTDEFGDDWFRMWQNYRLKNNQIDQEEFREYCDTLGLDRGEGRKFVEPFNQTHLVIDVLKGEAESMPWNFNIVNVSPSATNEIIRDKDRELLNYIDSKLSMEIEKNKVAANIRERLKAGLITKSEAQAEQSQIDEKHKKIEEKLLTPEAIEKKYASYKTTKEKTMYKLLSSIIVNENVRWTKNQTFEDALIAGLEVVEVDVDASTGLPTVRQLNPLNIFYHKSSDTPFLHDCDYVGYKEEMTVSDVLDKFGNDLEDKDLDRLRNYNSKVYGLDQKFHSPGGESVDHWDYRKRFEYTYRHPYSDIPSYGTTNVLSSGLYTSDRYRYRYENYCVVYTVYWRSQRRVGKLGFINDEGELEYTFVGETFKIPKRSVKRNYKPHMFSNSKTEYSWNDSKGLPRTLEWIWIPEVWKGIRINGDIYAKIEPYEHAYKSLLTPYKVKLPIHGFMYNNRNAFCISVMDRIKPWQKLYYVVMSKWLKLITQDKGVVQLLNVLMMDKKLGYEKSLQLAVDQGVLPYNPLANTQGTGLALANVQPSARLDLSNSEQIARYTEMLKFIESQLQMSAGISPARLAQTSSNTNVSDNMRDVQQSMNITSAVFNNHNMLWQEVLQSLLEITVKTMADKKGILRQILSDDELAIIDLDQIEIDDEYMLRVLNTGKQQQILENAKTLAQALIQNDKAKFSTLIDLIGTENLAEFKVQLKEIENEIDQRDAMMQQQQQEHEQKMQQMQQQAMQEEHQRQLEIEKVRGEYQLKKQEIASLSWSKDNDVNDNGVPDALEVEKIKNLSKQLDLQQNQAKDAKQFEQQKLDIEREKIESSERIAQSKAETDRHKALLDKEVKEKQIQAAKAKAKKSN